MSTKKLTNGKGIALPSAISSTTNGSKPPIKVLIGVLSLFERNGWHHPSITTFLHSLRWNNEYATNYVPIMNYQPAAAGRNVFCKHFLESEADVLCMIDNDMEVPLNLLDTIKDAPKDAEIVAPSFYLWDQGKPSVTLCWGMAAGTKNTVAKGEKEFFKMSPGFHQLTKCGTGVIFIWRSALQKLPYPWFKYTYNEDCGLASTEDIQFCNSATAAGIKIYGNSHVRIGHYHQVNLLVLADMIYNGLGTEDIRTNGADRQAEISRGTGDYAESHEEVEGQKQSTPSPISSRMARTK